MNSKLGLIVGFFFIFFSSCKKDVALTDPKVPVIIISNANHESQTTASCLYTLISGSDPQITSKGFCISKSPMPTINDFHSNVGQGNEASFTGRFTQLEPEIIYYIRGYAINSLGIYYSNQLTVKTPSIIYGGNYQGGEIFYILKEGDPGYDPAVQHGLITSSFNLSDAIEWRESNTGTVTGASGKVIGTGAGNTANIVATQGAGNYAAKICDDLVLNGYNDWCLPSSTEIYLLRNYLFQKNTPYYVFWSSTEINASSAFLSDSYYDNTQKERKFAVRAIRYF